MGHQWLAVPVLSQDGQRAGVGEDEKIMAGGHRSLQVKGTLDDTDVETLANVVGREGLT